MAEIPKMEMHSLTERYRREMNCKLLASKISDSFYTTAYTDLIQDAVEQIASSVKNNEELPDDIRAEMLKVRGLMVEVKMLRAGKIAKQALIMSRSGASYRGTALEDTSMLSKDPNGNEVALYAALRAAYDEFFKDA